MWWFRQAPEQVGPVLGTQAMRQVLTVLLTDGENIANSTIWRLVGGHVGKHTVCLAKLERLGWVTTRREENPPEDRPARTFYKLTPDGWKWAHVLLKLDEGTVRRGA